MAVYFQKREVVVPGQLLAEGRYRSSFGTYDEGGKIYSSLMGLAELRGNTVKVVALEGAYIPKEGDLVIGVITLVAGNNWKVDIGGPYGASLHANNALRRPYSDDISEYMDMGDVISAEVSAFDRQSGPFLSMKGRGLEVLEGGMVLEVSPAKIPRIIGRRGSMINMINDHLRIDTVIGQNGRIWIKSPDVKRLRLAIKAFKMIEDQAHTSNLTDRINRMLAEEVAKLGGSDSSEEPSAEVETVDEEEPIEDETVIEPEPEIIEAPEPEAEAESEAEIVEEAPVEEESEPEASTDEDDKPETEEVNE
ncbi:RNA-binding protein [Candidatus Thorarchaeota archaeon]|nr:MAG: RNA-binding protein [Candidatus Thorarchaeota archaeon]